MTDTNPDKRPLNPFDESATDAWRLRFGTEAPASADLFAPFLRHRSVRQFSNEPVSEELVSSLIGVAASASTSSSLQLWSVVSVRDRERREQLAKLCADYEHVRTAPWFFAFLADHHRLRHAASKVGEGAAGLGYIEFLIMAVIDAALAAERMVCAAESIGLGICYIGALRNDAPGVARVLDLPAGVFGAFGLCLGWPEQPLVSHIKPRLRQDAVWFKEQYDSAPGTSEFDERMQGFYESEGMSTEHIWSKKSGRRVDRNHLTGRHILKEWLELLGMGIE